MKFWWNFSRILVIFQRKFVNFFTWEYGGHGGHLGFPIGTILAIFYLQVILITKLYVNWPFVSGGDVQDTQFFLPSCKSIGPSVQGMKQNIDFHDCSHGDCLGFPTGTILAIFDLCQPYVSYQVGWPFGSGEEAKNRFSRWWPRRLSWISDWNDFRFFDLQVTPILPIKFRRLAFQFRRRS